MGPTTYCFTIVLVTFITGLALGSLLFGWFADRVANCLALLLAIHRAAALIVLGVSQLLGNSQLFFAKLIFTLKDHSGLLNAVKTTALFGFMLLPTLCFGASFPLVSRIYTRSIERVGRSIGFTYDEAIRRFAEALRISTPRCRSPHQPRAWRWCAKAESTSPWPTSERRLT